MPYRRLSFLILAPLAPALALTLLRPSAPALDLRLPLKSGSVRFAAIGDSGTGDKAQFTVGDWLERYRATVQFGDVLMLGDNIYGGHAEEDFNRKFERPYAHLLSAGVKFHASLGNHDDPSVETLYKPFNMDGHRYYRFRKGPVAFYALDSNYMDPVQLKWIDSQLAQETADWKIAFFHHPLYSDGKFHGSDLDLRAQLMPLFQKYGVNLVLSGHDHVYERLKPQNGIYFFVEGDSGQLRYGNLRKNESDEAAGDDTAQDMMLMEISGDQLYFQTVDARGATVDAGLLPRQNSTVVPATASGAQVPARIP